MTRGRRAVRRAWPPHDHPSSQVHRTDRGEARAADQRDRRCTSVSCAEMPDVGAVVHTHSRYAAAFVGRPPRPALHLQREHRHARRAGAGHGLRAAGLGRPRRSRRWRTFERQPGSRAVLAGQPRGRWPSAPTLGEAEVVAALVEWTAEICHLARTLRGRWDRGARARPRACRRRSDATTACRSAAPTGPMNADEVDRPLLDLAPLPVEGGFVTALAVAGDAEAPDGTAIWRSSPTTRKGSRSSTAWRSTRSGTATPGRRRAGAARARRHEPPRRARRRPGRGAAARARGAGRHVDGGPHDGALEPGRQRRWRPGSRRLTYEGGDGRPSSLAGWPSEREAIAARSGRRVSTHARRALIWHIRSATERSRASRFRSRHRRDVGSRAKVHTGRTWGSMKQASSSRCSPWPGSPSRRAAAMTTTAATARQPERHRRRPARPTEADAETTERGATDRGRADTTEGGADTTEATARGATDGTAHDPPPAAAADHASARRASVTTSPSASSPTSARSTTSRSTSRRGRAPRRRRRPSAAGRLHRDRRPATTTPTNIGQFVDERRQRHRHRRLRTGRGDGGGGHGEPGHPVHRRRPVPGRDGART